MNGPTRETIKLKASNLARLPAPVRVPEYDRTGILPGIVHIGVGGFFRAHQAVYLDDLLGQGVTPRWGSCGVGLLEHDFHMRDALQPQDCLYTVLECSAAGERARVIGSLIDYLYAPQVPERVIEMMAAPETRIVSLTITESGYYLDHGTGGFNEHHPDIVRDLEHPGRPRCSFGFIAEALDRRRRRGLDPFTLLSCDNLQQNGDVARRMLLAFAALRDPALSAWVERHGAFPNTMVDRITPTTEEWHRSLLRDRYSVDDAWPVVTEPFRQWVIEDKFAVGRPPWERAGAQMTSDVLPYEKIKIRLLNGTHQAICHIGRLLGYKSVHQAVADPEIRSLVRQMMDEEVSPLLPVVPGMEIEEYKKTLLERFANPAMDDQLSRIAMEGSARIPKFVLPSIAEQLDRGGPVRFLSFTVACWFRCLAGTDDQGRELPLVDPMADVLRERTLRGRADPGPLFGIANLFEKDLARSDRFVRHVTEALRSLYENGARATLQEWILRAPRSR
jgi:mannitol 2-dehydrogenase